MGKRDCSAGQPIRGVARDADTSAQFSIFSNIVISCLMIYHGVKKVIS